MGRPLEKGVHRSLFHQPAGVHDRHPVGGLGHHAEVVGDQQDGRAGVPGQIEHEGEDLPLDRDVQGRGRLVGDEQLRPQHKGHGDHHPLALAAGKFVGIAPQLPAGIGQPHPGEHGLGLGQSFPA